MLRIPLSSAHTVTGLDLSTVENSSCTKPIFTTGGREGGREREREVNHISVCNSLNLTIIILDGDCGSVVLSNPHPDVRSNCGEYHIEILSKFHNVVVNEGDIGTLGGAAASGEHNLMRAAVVIVGRLCRVVGGGESGTDREVGHSNHPGADSSHSVSLVDQHLRLGHLQGDSCRANGK